MNTITSGLSALARRVLIPVALAGAAILAPAFGILVNHETTTVSAQGGVSNYQGPGYVYSGGNYL